MNKPNRSDHKKKYVKQLLTHEEFHCFFVRVCMRFHYVHVICILIDAIFFVTQALCCLQGTNTKVMGCVQRNSLEGVE